MATKSSNSKAKRQMALVAALLAFGGILLAYILLNNRTPAPGGLIETAPANAGLSAVTSNEFARHVNLQSKYIYYIPLDEATIDGGELAAKLVHYAPIIAPGKTFAPAAPCALYFYPESGPIERLTILLQRPFYYSRDDFPTEPKRAKGADETAFAREYALWQEQVDLFETHNRDAELLSSVNPDILGALLRALDQNTGALTSSDILAIISALADCAKDAKPASLAYPPYLIEISADTLGPDSVLRVSVSTNK